MLRTVEIERHECESLLRHSVGGRVGLSTPNGPRIFAATYLVDGDEIVFRASPYSVLGTYGRDALLAFEIGEFNELPDAWSVTVEGRCSIVVDPDRVDRLLASWPRAARPNGVRHLFLRVPWKAISGRRVLAVAA